MAKHRSDMEQERRELRSQAEEQGQRLAQMERDRDRLQVEAQVREEEKKRLEVRAIERWWCKRSYSESIYVHNYVLYVYFHIISYIYVHRLYIDVCDLDK